MILFTLLPLLLPLQQDSGSLYVEKPGEMEFSDRMIVRPLPLDEFLEMDLDPAAASARREAAFARVANRVVRELPLNGEVVVDLKGEDPNVFGLDLGGVSRRAWCR